MVDEAQADDSMRRIAELERRVRALEERQGQADEAAPAPAGASRDSAGDAAGDERTWLLDQQHRLYPGTDLVSFGGSAQVGGNPENGTSTGTGVSTVQWQWSRPTDYLRERGLTPASDRLSALAHPVRLALLEAVLDGVDTAAGLAALEGMGTSGQIYHHLNQLAAAGWLAQARRGHWHVPPERVIPLLTIVMAAID